MEELETRERERERKREREGGVVGEMKVSLEECK